MALYRYIDDFTIGDTYKLSRTVENVPGGQLITEAFWTVKKDETDSDSDAAFLLSINPEGSTSGAVNNYDDGTASLDFIALPSDSLMMDGNETYSYDIHITFDSGEKYALEIGKLFTGPHVLHVH
jgi:hypothetical protein